jgi:hypothetical protein
MVLDEIRKWKEAEPFRKFKLVLSSGEELVVQRRGELGIAPEGRFLVYPLEPAGYRVVRPADITTVDLAEGSAA